MIGKLIKTEVNYILEDDKGVIIASTSLKKEGLALSLKNCEVIANGDEFDEYEEGIFYAGNFGHPSPEGFSDEQVGRLHGFIDGFQKALEILGGKKFSEEDMKMAMQVAIHSVGVDNDGEHCYSTLDIPNYIQSLQQTEWDVEIEMSVCVYDDSLGGFPTSYQEGMPIEKPKLDTNGCLILKRK